MDAEDYYTVGLFTLDLTPGCVKLKNSFDIYECLVNFVIKLKRPKKL